MRQAAIKIHEEAGVDRSGPWGRDSFAKFQTALKPNQLYVWSPAPPPERPTLIFKGTESGQPIHLLATGREEVEDSQEVEEDSQEEEEAASNPGVSPSIRGSRVRVAGVTMM